MTLLQVTLLHVIVKVAEVLDVPPSFFYTPDDELAELIKIFSTLNEDGRNKMFKQINTPDLL